MNCMYSFVNMIADRIATHNDIDSTIQGDYLNGKPPGDGL